MSEAKPCETTTSILAKKTSYSKKMKRKYLKKESSTNFKACVNPNWKWWFSFQLCVVLVRRVHKIFWIGSFTFFELLSFVMMCVCVKVFLSVSLCVCVLLLLLICGVDDDEFYDGKLLFSWNDRFVLQAALSLSLYYWLFLCVYLRWFLKVGFTFFKI